MRHSIDENQSTDLDEIVHRNFLMQLMDTTVMDQSIVDNDQSTNRVRVRHRRVSSRLYVQVLAYEIYMVRGSRSMFEIVSYFYLVIPKLFCIYLVICYLVRPIYH